MTPRRSVHKFRIHSVGVRDFRGELRHWLDLVRDGDHVVLTDRGKPVARLVPERGERRYSDLIERMRGTTTTGLSTDEIMALTRGE